MKNIKSDNIIFEGFISIESAILANSRNIIEIYYCHTNRNSIEISNLKKLAFKRKIKMTKVEKEFIASLARGKTHGGIIALVTERKYQKVSDSFFANKKFIVIMQGIEDPFNYGHSLRSLYAAGVDGLIIPNRIIYGADGVIAKSSAGASEMLPTCLIDDNQKIIDYAKNHNYTVISTIKSKKAISLYDRDYKYPILLIMGGEKRGISEIFLTNSDCHVIIPYAKKYKHSLPTDFATSIIAFEIMRQNK